MLLDGEAAAAHLGVKPRQVRALVDRGELPFIRVGRLVRFHPDDLAAYVDRQRTVKGGRCRESAASSQRHSALAR